MARPASNTIQYVGLEEQETNSHAVGLQQPLTEGSTNASPIPAAPRCKGKLCLAKGMIWVALALFVAAVVTPNWTHSSSTVRVFPAANSNEQTQPDNGVLPPSPPPIPNEEASELTEESSGDRPPMPPPDNEDSEEHSRRHHGHHGHHGHHPTGLNARVGTSVQLSDNSTLIGLTAHTGLWRTCVNDHCFKMKCCKKNNASPLCGRSKATGALLITGASLLLLSLLTLCCQSRGKFAGSRKVYIAPVLLFAVLVLGTSSLILSHKTLRLQRRLPADAMMWHPDQDHSSVSPRSELVLHDVQFGSSFYMAVMGMSLLFFAWLAVLGNSCHERCAAVSASGHGDGHCEGRRRRCWFWRRFRSEPRVSSQV